MVAMQVKGIVSKVLSNYYIKVWTKCTIFGKQYFGRHLRQRKLWLQVHLILLLGAQLTVSSDRFKYCLCAEHVTSHQYLNQWWPNSLTYTCITRPEFVTYDDLIKWKHFLRYWRIVLGIHRSPVNFPHKGQWRAALMFSLICIWIDVWVNNWDTGDLRCHGTHYDVTVMK